MIVCVWWNRGRDLSWLSVIDNEINYYQDLRSYQKDGLSRVSSSKRPLYICSKSLHLLYVIPTEADIWIGLWMASWTRSVPWKGCQAIISWRRETTKTGAGGFFWSWVIEWGPHTSELLSGELGTVIQIARCRSLECIRDNEDAHSLSQKHGFSCGI